MPTRYQTGMNLAHCLPNAPISKVTIAMVADGVVFVEPQPVATDDIWGLSKLSKLKSTKPAIVTTLDAPSPELLVEAAPDDVSNSPVNFTRHRPDQVSDDGPRHAV